LYRGDEKSKGDQQKRGTKVIIPCYRGEERDK
jgi:hypothetical protein